MTDRSDVQDRPLERWEIVHEAMANLVRQHRFQDAADLLERERAESRQQGSSSEVAFFSNLLGSMLFILHREEEGLVAYRDAEAAAPHEGHYKLTVASKLLDLDRPAEALEKATEALQQLNGQRGWHHGLYGLLGTVYLALDRTDDAVTAFRELVRSDVLAGLLRHPRISRGLDLRLAAELLRRTLIVDEVRRYVEVVKKKAEEEGDLYVVNEANNILPTT